MRRLSGELVEASNLISRKDSFGSWRTADEGELLGRLAESKKAADQVSIESVVMWNGQKGTFPTGPPSALMVVLLGKRYNSIIVNSRVVPSDFPSPVAKL